MRMAGFCRLNHPRLVDALSRGRYPTARPHALVCCWRKASPVNETSFIKRFGSNFAQLSGGSRLFCSEPTPIERPTYRDPAKPRVILPPFAHQGSKDLNYSTWDNVAVLVDKPTGWTSNDVCGKLKYAIGRKWKRGMKKKPHKVGHAGTLDPMATGLLIIFFGKATKTVSYFVDQFKEYTGTFRLGETTSTLDADSHVEEVREWQHITDDDLETARHQFIGDLEQVPPMFSAVKVGGLRLYKLARAGQEVKREPRSISVYEFELKRESGSQDVDFRLACSKGTYVRTIASDLGEVLGCGAHIVKLRRTAIGDRRVEDAWTVDALVDAIKETRGVVSDKDGSGNVSEEEK
ncbi:hypothetical protein BSKO_11495 [Bryopsis sp. KO-2023]|nr:hypothetical protein BSKO_11495 [Bryopsis sp. KO-2023]